MFFVFVFFLCRGGSLIFSMFLQKNYKNQLNRTHTTQISEKNSNLTKKTFILKSNLRKQKPSTHTQNNLTCLKKVNKYFLRSKFHV